MQSAIKMMRIGLKPSTSLQLSVFSRIFVSHQQKSSSRYRHDLVDTYSATNADHADHCDLHIVQSPYPPIPDPPYLPLPEFITQDWMKPQTHEIRNKDAILDGSTGQTRSFHDYYQGMTSIAAYCKNELSITEDSTMALFSPNHVDYVPICLAAALCGCKLTPINPQYKANELATILDRSQADVLIVHSSILPVAHEAIQQLRKHHTGDPTSHVSRRSLRHVVTIPIQDNHVQSLSQSQKQVPQPEKQEIKYHALEDVKKYPKPMTHRILSTTRDVSNYPYLLPYSSGTTGLPKAVCLSHRNIVSNLLQFDEIESMPFPSDHKLICPLPFFHIYGFTASAMYTAWRGQELITMSGRFDLELFCQLCEKYRPQRAHLVPPILLQIAKNPIVDKYDLSSLKMIISAAAPLSKDIENAIYNRIGAEVKQAWGMSELSPIGTMNSDFNIKSGSVGPLVSNTLGKVIDPKTGRSLPPHQSGELVIKGPQVMLGYLNEPKKTAECLSPKGWLKTGDVAYYDEDGFFFITDRIKEMIKVRGFQVAPAELESLLLTHPNIADAAVIPVEDESSGELPRAYVVRKLDEVSSTITEDQVKAWVKERVAPMKRLDGGVVFIKEVPKSASGKILRRILVDKAREDKIHQKM